MANHEPVGSTGEASVGDEGAVVTETRAHDGGGRGEHLGHAGATLGSLVLDDDDGTLEGLGVLGEGGEHELLGVVALGETLEVKTLLAGDLGHGSLGGDVAVEGLEMAGLLDGLLDGHDNLLALGEVGAGREVLSHGLAGAGHAAAVDETLGHEVLLRRNKKRVVGQRKASG